MDFTQNIKDSALNRNGVFNIKALPQSRYRFNVMLRVTLTFVMI
jgi:hypothetical protein